MILACEKCNKEHNGSYGSGRFCSSKCARGFSTKANREDINNKIRKKLKESAHKKIQKTCPECNSSFLVNWNKRNQITCSNKCRVLFRNKNEVYLNNLSTSMKKLYSSIEARNRLKEIGKMGGFGKKGFTKGGIRYESIFEKNVFEFLENNKILFEPHKSIPNSAKISDLYLINKKLWIELDGINREKKKKWIGKDYQYWLEKLELYKKQNLNLKIFLTFDDFKKFMSL